MKSSAHIKFTKPHSTPFITFNYWQLVMLIFLPPCNGGLSLHTVTYKSNSHTGGTAVTSSQFTPSLQICANLCTEQTDRDETTCFSYSYSASHQMCYLSSDLSLNVGKTTYTIKGKEFIFLRSTLKSLFYKKTFFQIKTEPSTTIHSDSKFFFFKT